ncbi:tRNA-intron lyase [Candidatus Micrarchaeota archaeon]|nr:tRNA-intron lyase [Candidatus Micrarchaeota archaeon]
MAVQFELDDDKLLVKDLISVQALDRGYFGTDFQGKKNLLELIPEEALYLMDVRNAICLKKKRKISFNQVARRHNKEKKFLARYFCYKDWRDRGIIARRIDRTDTEYGRSPVVKYPSKEFLPLRIHAKAMFFSDDLMAIIDDETEGQRVYEERWFGQYGTYKAKKHGRFLKLDAYETLFLIKHAGLKTNVSETQLIRACQKRRKDFLALYEVFEDWRLRSFVLKTGFKFGTHFRLYFPGASPKLGNEEWMHSKHVIHVFPRENKMLISEWARAIRVAHGVKKTFILAIPGVKTEKPAEVDFLLYHRKKGGLIENPKQDSPKFVMLALSEEEEIGGEELAQAIEKSKGMGLDLMLAICDRETAITYYRVKRVELPKSKYEYYEIEWKQP